MKHTTIIVAVGLALTATLSAAPAYALAYHTFVSPTGSDSNPCTLALPCRNLQAALTQTTSGGEIAILGTAGYSGSATLTIDRAISIVNTDAYEARISPPSGGTGIVINAGVNDAVSLRGLTIDGAGVGAIGIQFNSGGSLTVENSVIRNLTGAGIAFLSNANGNLLVSNTLVADNDKGIQVFPGASVTTLNAVFNRIEAINNATYGIVLNGSNLYTDIGIQGTATDCVAAYNGVGFIAIGANIPAVPQASLALFHVAATNNGTGIEVKNGGAVLTLAQSMVEYNNYGWQICSAGCFLYSFGDNYSYANSNNTGSLAPLPKN